MMAWLHRLVVPLDGSQLAEAALPAAVDLARRFSVTITLLHVMERGAPRTVHGQRHLADQVAAETYLKGIAERLAGKGLSVDYHVHPNPEGDVARSISEHSVELAAELVVMCTHGSGGLRDLLVGSIAQQVLRKGATAVLLIRPTPSGEALPFECRRLLVPLDGDPSHEVALPFAVEMARACNSEVHLLVVVPTLESIRGEQAAIAVLTPTATAHALDLEEGQAAVYLSQTAARLQASGVAASATVRRGDPVRVVVEVADQIGADLVVAATHGRPGLDALWSGGVGSRVLARLKQPLLLVRAGSEESAPLAGDELV